MEDSSVLPYVVYLEEEKNDRAFEDGERTVEELNF